MSRTLANAFDAQAKNVLRNLSDAERQKIWGLTVMGLSNRNIALQVDINYELIRYIVKELAKEQVEDLGGIDVVRVIEASKLDDLTIVWAKQLQKFKKLINDGIAIDEKQLERCTNQLVKIAERKSRLLGLDAPIKHQVNLRVFDQFTTQLIEIIQAHCTPDIQRKINRDITKALSVAEKYRNENEEEAEWTQNLATD